MMIYILEYQILKNYLVYKYSLEFFEIHEDLNFHKVDDFQIQFYLPVDLISERMRAHRDALLTRRFDEHKR